MFVHVYTHANAHVYTLQEAVEFFEQKAARAETVSQSPKEGTGGSYRRELQSQIHQLQEVLTRAHARTQTHAHTRRSWTQKEQPRQS